MARSRRDYIYEPKERKCKRCGKPYLKNKLYQFGDFCGYNCREYWAKEHPKKTVNTMKKWG
jgi:endogenous inhibitor of DNA gyrase (YacG/DUF329 family)